MNRLVLIGNGFDLAHDFNTSYANFINWYWEQWGERLRSHAEPVESDELCSFKLKGNTPWYARWSGNRYQKEDYTPCEAKDIVRIAKEDKNLCDFNYLSPFFEQINKSIETKRWVDIEHEYYSQLINLKNYKLTINRRERDYQTLNKRLEFLRDKLIEYLLIESKRNTIKIEEIEEKIYRPIMQKEIAVGNKKLLGEHFLVKYYDTSYIMLLNFNYTDTPLRYTEWRRNITINYIHGHLDDPKSVIFGYGDELDKEFPRLKEEYDNECLRHAKSTNYLESDNYRKMLEFIESEPFQVVIMGHSCGTSDRTLLNTIFEHPNCVSIKPYYYINDKGEDNYQELVQNIYRNFTDMKLMRDRVVSKEKCEPLSRGTGSAVS